MSISISTTDEAAGLTLAVALSERLVPRGERGAWRAGMRAGERATVRAAQQGPEEAIEKLFRQYWPVAFRAATYITRDRAAAEDIAQESFLAAIRALEGFDRGRPFGPWFKRLVANRAIDWSRARQVRGREVTADEPELRAVDEARAGTKPPAFSSDLAAAVSGLPLEQRTLVVLRYLLEYTPGEISKILGIPRGTVNSRLRRGLDALRDRIEEA